MPVHFIKLCIVFFLCSPASSEVNTESQRVFHGKQTSHRAFPFAISIILYDTNARRWSYHCGGSIISQSSVLTAAHCVVVYPSYQGSRCVAVYPGGMNIVAGADYVWRGSQLKQQSYVRSILVHPSCYFYQTSVLAYDTAVLTLQNPFSWSAFVSPVRIFSGDAATNLREYDRIARTGGWCYVVGYGHTGSAGILSNVIQYGDMTLLTNRECDARFCRFNGVFCNANFGNTAWACAETKLSTPCRGDSGGPLVCNGLLFGVVSWGRGCFSDVRNPAVFADMAAITYMFNVHRSRQRERERIGPEETSFGDQQRSSYRIIIMIAVPLLLR